MLQDGREHAPETLWKAQELYCLDRFSFAKVAEITGVAASTLKRWSAKYDWQAKRAELAQAESEIRVNKVLARSKLIASLLEAPRADTAFAVSALESLTLKETEVARLSQEREAEQAVSATTVPITDKRQAVGVLKQVIENKLSWLLSRPENVDLKAIQEVQKCMALLVDMQTSLPVENTEAHQGKGLEQAMYDRLMNVLSGKVDI